MDVIKKPLLTEKVTHQTDKFNRYSFIVDVNANKLQIKSAVESAYNVQVDKVNTMHYLGKIKSRSLGMLKSVNAKKAPVKGRRASLKKAIVFVKKGDVIDFYKDI